MSKLIDEDTNTVFRCVCGGYHYFELSMVEYPENHRSVFVTFVERPKRLRERLHVIKAALTGETVYHGELEIDDVKEFKKVVAKL